MSLFDELKKQVGDLMTTATGGEAGASASPGALLDGVLGMIKSGGLTSLVDKFKQAGLETAVASWVGKGANLPVEGGDIRNAIGIEAIEAVAAKLGIDAKRAEEVIAQVLPGVIDKMTPHGNVEEAVAVEEEAPVEEEETAG